MIGKTFPKRKSICPVGGAPRDTWPELWVLSWLPVGLFRASSQSISPCSKAPHKNPALEESLLQLLLLIVAILRLPFPLRHECLPRQGTPGRSARRRSGAPEARLVASCPLERVALLYRGHPVQR